MVRTVRKQQRRHIKRVDQNPLASVVAEQIFGVVMDNVVAAYKADISEKSAKTVDRYVVECRFIVLDCPDVMNFFVIRAYLNIYNGIFRWVIIFQNRTVNETVSPVLIVTTSYYFAPY